MHIKNCATDSGIFQKFTILKWYHKIRYDLPENTIKEGCYHLEMKKN